MQISWSSTKLTRSSVIFSMTEKIGKISSTPFYSAKELAAVITKEDLNVTHTIDGHTGMVIRAQLLS